MIDKYNWDKEYNSDAKDRATHPDYLLSSLQMAGNDISNLHQQVKSIKHTHIYIYIYI